MELQKHGVRGTWLLAWPGLLQYKYRVHPTSLLVSSRPGRPLETRIVLRHSSHIGVGSDIYMDGR